MSRSVIRREEFIGTSLKLGKKVLDLSDYATTGLRAAIVGPSGVGKTSAAISIAEQLTDSGKWIAVLVDPEGELESLYGEAVASPAELVKRLKLRDRPIVVVSAATASDFVPYAEVVLDAADQFRKPIVMVVDETQLFSKSRRSTNDAGKASELLNDIASRGRKRALDLVVTATRFSGTLNRALFTSKNLTLIGRTEDSTAWSALAPLFQGTKIGFSALMALAPGEFFCFSLSGVERVAMKMAKALQGAAIQAKPIQPVLPTTFSQWNRAMRAVPTARLQAIDADLIDLLGTVAGLTTQQLLSGNRALRDELASRA